MIYLVLFFPSKMSRQSTDYEVFLFILFNKMVGCWRARCFKTYSLKVLPALGSHSCFPAIDKSLVLTRHQNWQSFGLYKMFSSCCAKCMPCWQSFLSLVNITAWHVWQMFLLLGDQFSFLQQETPLQTSGFTREGSLFPSPVVQSPKQFPS